jgi:hypothetical protein
MVPLAAPKRRGVLARLLLLEKPWAPMPTAPAHTMRPHDRRSDTARHGKGGVQRTWVAISHIKRLGFRV